MDEAAAIFGIFFFAFWILMMGLMVFGTVFWVWMLVDCAQRDFGKKSDEKVLWILIILLGQLIGAVIYYFVVKRKALKK